MNKNKKNIKNNNSKWWVSGLIISAFVLFFPYGANAATINLFSNKDSLSIGDEFSIDLKIDSESVGINAAQATLQYTKDLVSVVNVDKTDSVLNFWLVEPSVDNTLGTINFIGGSTSGLSGKSLQVLRVVFKVIGTGTISLTLNDSAVTASDGSGTNVLTATKGIELSSLVKTTVSVIVPTVTNPAPEIAPNAPAKPVISVLLYPNPNSWHDVSQNFVVNWNLPKDVTEVAAVLNKIPVFNPSTSEGLFDNKSFPPLGNGVSYLHIRFKNNIGWGITNNYRIAIDTVPPLPFKVSSVDGFKTENPFPSFSFSTKDSISGIANYIVRIDNTNEIISKKDTLVLPGLNPGQHRVVVQAVDNAGNSTEDSVSLEIVPLATPTVGLFNKSVSFGEFVYASGKVNAGLGVQVKLNSLNGQEVFNGKGTIDSSGNWEILIKNPLSVGQYTLTVVAINDLGASSYPAETQFINVRAQPIISIGLLQLGWSEIVLLLIFIFIAIAGFYGWYYVSRKNKSDAYKTVIGMDVRKLTAILENDLNALKETRMSSKPAESKKTEIGIRIDKMEENINKMKKYLPAEIDKIG
ncbi:MAG: cohesin domain-containing protein [Minisyncoccia bacterium]